MLSEEEIIDIVKKEITNTYAERKAKALQGLLDLYNKEKEKNKGLNATLTLVNIGLENYISKDKIKEKIKELENQKDLYFEKQIIQGKIDLLKELLEEGK